MCKIVRDLVCSARRIQVKEIAQALGISQGSVSTMSHDRLGMRKLAIHLGPKNPLAMSKGQPEYQYSALVEAFKVKR